MTEEQFTILYIQLQRIYDLLLLDMSQESAKKIREAHEQGYFFAPDPALRQDEPDETE